MELSFEPLKLVSFLDRAAAAHGDRTAVVDGAQRFTYTQLRDRSKDVIISGGENIVSVEVEQALAEHPAAQRVDGASG